MPFAFAYQCFIISVCFVFTLNCGDIGRSRAKSSVRRRSLFTYAICATYVQCLVWRTISIKSVLVFQLLLLILWCWSVFILCESPTYKFDFRMIRYYLVISFFRTLENKNEITTPYEINCLFYASDSAKQQHAQVLSYFDVGASARNEIRQIEKKERKSTNNKSNRRKWSNKLKW